MKQIFIPFAKTDDEQRMVYGYASTEALDSQGEVVKIEALKAALPDYMKFANVREMHSNKAAGKVKESNIDKNGWFVGVKVVADDAWKLVKEQVYNGFSIGGKVLEKIDDEITKLKLSEISLVDRPANPEAVFSCVKFDGEKMKKDKQIEKDVVGAQEAINLAVQAEQIAVGEAIAGEDTTAIDTAVTALKEHVATELAEPEAHENIVAALKDEAADETAETFVEPEVEEAEMPMMDEKAEEGKAISEEKSVIEKLNEISELLKSMNKAEEKEEVAEEPEEEKEEEVKEEVEEKEVETVVTADDETEKIEKIDESYMSKLEGLTAEVVELKAKVASYEELKERFERVEKAAMPAKIETFAIDRFGKSEQSDKAELLKKIDDCSARLKADPSNPAIQKEAKELQSEYMASNR